MLNIILFGPPGSGKGTQAVKIAEEFNLLHISTGDLLRNEVKTQTHIGLEAKTCMDKGELVPDEVMIGMISNNIDEYAGKVKGIIFDGFPRTIPQAEALDKLLEFKQTNISKVLALEVDEEEIVERILVRGKSSGRSDDNDEATIRRRFNVYQRETSPVAQHYHQQDKLISLKGIGEIEEIFEQLKAAIEVLV